ncbi:zinc carboxypeptidase [Salegentibacter salinarum]|uniref:Zinc carboxypeptidase n=1 Tax=Salegentibacter salinarum TaxID=447422 RepID=A0A2N0TUE8_9FLAO|nr:M14 family metallopeptidase [Salegentibacter salinarum]PKD18373.1 zinc carboxypeptidase [Salegentibacter salinarum]SKB44725.1 Zinc carboxypeptidase [Salegentibacter salinarum]
MKSTLLSFVFLFVGLHISAQLQSPEEFLGYEIGQQFSRHADVVNYFEHAAENSPLVNYHTYGKTNERRPLTYAVISMEENLRNLEEIRNKHLGNTGISETVGEADKAIVWLSYNVHGNEASATEAAMKTLFELITAKEDWLENTVVIIDPSVNPDGRDRYVNWYNQVKAEPYDPMQAAAEHHEPWPGGRPNHYLFDLNRDWAWATQVETQQRLKIYNQWMPHIHVDFHEQGINEPYYFAPAAEPFHEIITPFQREFQTEIGKNHAKYFDEEGWLFFTRERFDLLYPSYGDTYPTYMGAIGMTYEQAGHGRAGLGINTDEGYELTLKDRVAHHHTTGLSTVEIATKNIEALNTEFKKYFDNSELEYKSYAVKGNPDKIASLKELLEKHEIQYQKAASGRVNGFNYTEGKTGRFNADKNTLVINTNQPKGKMVNVLFEPKTTLTDSLTYDITAWSLPYAYGLEAVASTREVDAEANLEVPEIKNSANPSGAGYVVKWNALQDAQFLAELLNENIKVRFTEIPFKSEGKDFDRGSLIITKSDNRTHGNFDKTVIEIANKHQRELVAANTSFAAIGPDFGSPEVKLINPPKVAVLKGEGTSSLNYGEIWHFFEQDLNYPLTSINTDYFKNVDLSQFDVLIMPEGFYSNVLYEETLKMVKDWVNNGGKLIAIGSAVGTFAKNEGFNLKENKSETKDTTTVGNLIPYTQRERESAKDMITGSIVKTKLDNTHPMAFGYDDTYFSLKLSNSSYKLLEDGYNVSYIQQPEIVAGFAGSSAVKNLENSLVFGEERMGSGSIIYMVDNPLFRAFWENGKMFFTNSIFFVNNNKFRL